MIDQLKKIFGVKCTGISINGLSERFLNHPGKKMKFCEAVHHSFDLPLEITDKNLGCPGARRSIGFDNQSDELVKMISGNTGIPENYISDSFKDIPIIQTKVNNLILGIPEDMEEEIKPDVFIIYTIPEKIMKFIHQLAGLKIKPYLPPYSLNSICGNVFARAYQDEKITISFGCPESRNFGGVEKEEVVIGLPASYAEKFLNNVSIKT